MCGFVIENEETDDNGELTLKAEIRREMVGKLAQEWNDYHTRIEQRGWISDEERYQEADYHACMAGDAAYEAASDAEEKNPDISKEELAAIRQKAEDEYYAEVNKRARLDHERIAVIEELLGELGARMMRPYEHWNEDERYMEYMETRHDNDPYG